MAAEPRSAPLVGMPQDIKAAAVAVTKPAANTMVADLLGRRISLIVGAWWFLSTVRGMLI
jgi:hypothetical protein